MKSFKIIILALILATLEIALTPRINFRFSSFNLFFTALFLIALFSKSYSAYPAAIAGGLLLDLFSVHPLGTFTLIYLILVFLLTLAREKFFRHPEGKIFLLLAFSSALFFWSGKIVMLKMFGLDPKPVLSHFSEPFINTLLIILIALFLPQRRRLDKTWSRNLKS